MSVGDTPRVELPSEFQSALGKLQKLFAGVLWDAKLNSCSAAWMEIKRTKNAKRKVEILNEKARQWREDSVKAIKEWLPKFLELAEAYPEVVDGGALQWTKDRIWERVEAQCEIRRPKDGEPLRHDRITRTMVYWFAVASEGNVSVNLPPLRPWKAPPWLARNGRETDALLSDHTSGLWLRLNHVIDEELDVAYVQTTIRSRETTKAQTQSTSDLRGATGVDTWASFHASFQSLSKEEVSFSLSERRDRRVTAFSMGDMKEWHIGGGINENFRARAEMLATSAGAKLGDSPPGLTKLNYWLHRLHSYLEKSHSPLLFAPIGSEKMGTIVSVCEASANLCARLEQEAIEGSASKSDRRLARRTDVSAQAKLADPAKFPTMTVRNVMTILGFSRATVYRCLDDGRLDRPGLNKKPGKRSRTLILTASVLKMLEPGKE